LGRELLGAPEDLLREVPEADGDAGPPADRRVEARVPPHELAGQRDLVAAAREHELQHELVLRLHHDAGGEEGALRPEVLERDDVAARVHHEDGAPDVGDAPPPATATVAQAWSPSPRAAARRSTSRSRATSVLPSRISPRSIIVRASSSVKAAAS